MAIAVPASLFELQCDADLTEAEGSFLHQLPVSLIAELKPMRIAMSTVKRYEIGSIIFLPATMRVTLRVGTVPHFVGRMGSVGQQRAIQIDAVVDDDSS